MTSQLPARIDMHSHFLPDFYQAACRQHGHANPDGMPYLPDWSADAHLAMMDRQGIARSVLSISSPGTHLVAGDDASARELTRACNRFAADLKARHPARFGFFASLPLPDVAGSLAEIPRALAEGADGFVLETNHHGHYLGDAALDAVFDELNRRRALVFVHPTTPKCLCDGGAAAAAEGSEKITHATPLASRGVPNPMLEFLFDTARVVSHLFMSGTLRRCPELRIVLPHLGGAFVPLLARWTGFSALLPLPGGEIGEAEVRAVLARQFWFDLAGFAFPGQIRAAMAGAGVAPARLLYGSDYPFTREPGVELLRGQMDGGVRELFGDDEIEDIYHRNAEKLLAMR